MMNWRPQIEEEFECNLKLTNLERKTRLTQPSRHAQKIDASETVQVQQQLDAEQGLDFYRHALEALKDVNEAGRIDEVEDLRHVLLRKIEWAEDAIRRGDASEALSAGLDIANGFHALLHAIGVAANIADGQANLESRRNANKANADKWTRTLSERDRWICSEWELLCTQKSSSRPMSLNAFHRHLKVRFLSQGFPDETVLPGRKGIEKILLKHKKLERTPNSSNKT